MKIFFGMILIYLFLSICFLSGCATNPLIGYITLRDRIDEIEVNQENLKTVVEVALYIQQQVVKELQKKKSW